MRGRTFFNLIVVAGLLLPRPVAAEPPRREVLVLNQSSAGSPFNTALASAIRSTINAGSKSPTSFYSEHLDANRFFGPEYENEIVQFLKAKYRERHIDVVIVVGVSALDSLGVAANSFGRRCPLFSRQSMKPPCHAGRFRTM
jgi:hypothetical protein